MLQYLFIYLKAQHLHKLAVIPPGAWGRETLLPGPLMCERRDGEMCWELLPLWGVCGAGGGEGGWGERNAGDITPGGQGWRVGAVARPRDD